MKERRIINGELCERVATLTDVHLLDVVYVACSWHPGTFHRGCLIRYLHNVKSFTSDKPDRAIIVSGWELMPKPKNHNRAFYMVSDDAVMQGLVWRVINITQVQQSISKLKTAKV